MRTAMAAVAFAAVAAGVGCGDEIDTVLAADTNVIPCFTVDDCAWLENQCQSFSCEGGRCSASERNLPEVCGNGCDDDCDNAVDEGCRCEGGLRFDRDCGFGPPPANYCRLGIQFCTSAGVLTECQGGDNPTAESCGFAHADMDCDGVWNYADPDCS